MMKTIGLIGGMSWESTALYYRTINEGVKARLGGLHSARLILYSVDFAEIEQFQSVGDWDAAGAVLATAAAALKRAGADVLILCSNTMHKVSASLEPCGLPFLHIADPTAEAVLRAGHTRVGLLGTRFTMEQGFYRDRLSAKGLEVITPGEADRETVNRVIYEELCLGRILDPSRRAYLEVIDRLSAGGAEAVILGCTEITLLIGPGDTSAPVFDTTAIHADAAVDLALSGSVVPG